MKETITKLVDLQRADHRAQELRRRRDELDGGLAGARRGVDAAKAELDVAHRAAQEARSHVHLKEMDLRQREEEIRQLNGKLGTATSNKEYQSYVLRIGELTVDNSRTEDAILQAMDEADAKDRVHEAAKAKLRDAEAALREAESKVGAQRQSLEAEIAAAVAQRDEIASAVPAEQLRIYERIRAGNKKSGTAVAVVHGEYCQSCQMAITSQELTELVRGQKLVICRTCQRILVLEA